MTSTLIEPNKIFNVKIACISHVLETKDEVIVDWQTIDADKITYRTKYPNNKSDLFPIFIAVNRDFEWAHNDIRPTDLIGLYSVIINYQNEFRAVALEMWRSLDYKRFKKEAFEE